MEKNEKMIYLDNLSTTQIDPRVLEAMMPYLSENCGNPSNLSHSFGRKAAEVVEDAREKVANLIGADPHEIIFTSGATESNNTILNFPDIKIIISEVEHSSIFNTALSNDKKDKTSIIGVDTLGKVISNNLYRELSALVSVDSVVSLMLANNETGVIQPVERIFRHIKKASSLFRKVVLHSDIAQAVGKIPVNVKSLCLNYASLSSHKIYGPKGVGALYIEGCNIRKPFINGGSQEWGMRAGTLNVPGIVGFGKACEIAEKNLLDEMKRVRKLKSRMLCRLSEGFSETPRINGSLSESLPGALNIILPCNNMEKFKAEIGEKVALSYGSACSQSKFSRVIKAMGVDEETAKKSLRIGIGRFNTKKDIDKAANHIIKIAKSV